MASDLMNPAQCNICEAATAKFNCNTCGDALCATCKVHHLKSKASKNHVTVPYAEKLNPKYLTTLLCPKHQTHGPNFWCDMCSVPICNSCITSNEHKGHEYSDITAILSERRDAMLAEMKTLRDHTVVEWEGVLQLAKTMTAEYQNGVEEIGKELVARAKEMHKQVDNILETSQKTLQQMKASGLAKLQQQEKYLEDKLRQMKEDVESYENQLRDADPNAVLQFQQGQGQSTKEIKPPVLEPQSPPVFTEGQIDTDAMENLFGQLSTQVIPEKIGEVPKKPTTSQLTVSSDSGETKTNSLGAYSAGSSTKRSLILNPSVQSKFDVGHYHPYIACIEGGRAWVQTKYEKLQLMDRDGSVRDTINTGFYINGMVVTSDGDILLPDYKNTCIRCVSIQKTIITLFSTSWKPTSLCCLHNGDIVVTFPNDRKVVIYSRTGEIRQKMDHIKFRRLQSVSENKANQDIYICDKEYNTFDSAGKVMAVGADGKLRYEYTGQGDSLFTPVWMCTDQMGHILITDYRNHRVHILNQEGRFIQYILTSQQGLHQPYSIDIDREGYVWVGESVDYCKGHVRVARYLQ